MIVLSLLLSACSRGDGERPPPPFKDDPLMAAVLAGPLLTDPDLVELNTANQLASFPTLDGSVPLPDKGADAVAAAREEAAAMIGGHTAMRRAPRAKGASDENPAGLMAQVDALGTAPSRCAARATRTFGWAARMPEPFPVYPRGAALEAAGVQSARCSLRAIAFSSAVEPAALIDFYFSLATGAGYSASRLRHADSEVLSGSRGEARYRVSVRRDGDGFTIVQLVTFGA